MNPPIRTEALTRRYGRHMALDGLDLAVPEGSIFGLVGPNAYSTYAGQLEAVTVSTEEPVAWVRAPLKIAGIRLGAYEAALK